MWVRNLQLSENGCFQKIGIPQNGRFMMENPIKMAIKMDDLEEKPLFLETPKCFEFRNPKNPPPH